MSYVRFPSLRSLLSIVFLTAAAVVLFASARPVSRTAIASNEPPASLSIASTDASKPGSPLTPNACEAVPIGNIEVEGTGGSSTQPSGYPTLGAAFTAINSGFHTGSISIDVCGNTTEVATAALNASGSGTALYSSITIRPSGGAARTISGTLAAELIQFNGADNVTIDGLNTGGNSLTIANLNSGTTSGTSTLRFFNDATGNTIANSTILGSASISSASNGGTIFFSTAASSGGGNDNNTISNNNIGPAGATLPTKAIYGNGTTTTTSTYNSGIVITGNNIYDFFNPATQSNGVLIGGGNTDWTISNNRLYQTSQRTQTTATIHSPIQIASANVNNCSITGNIIGSATSAGTGVYDFVGSGPNSRFYPIVLTAHGTATPTSIQGNTIGNISVTGNVSGTGTGPSAPFAGILVAAGAANIGDVTGNTIGSTSAGSSISVVSSSSSAADIYGIFYNTTASPNISNNIVGGITVDNSAGNAVDLYGIRAQTNTGATNTIQSNTVGFGAAPIVNNSLNAISNTYGIVSQSGGAAVAGNIVSNLTMAAGSGSSGANATMIGLWIDNPSTALDSTIAQNTVRFLTNTDAVNNDSVQGILYNGGASGTRVIERNLVHSITVPNSPTGTINGIYVLTGTAAFQNNIVALGTGITNGAAITGINEIAGTNNFFHNSIYIGGSGVAGGANTFAFNSGVTGSARSYRDNIFVNARSNGAGTGKHYAIQVGGTGANPAGLTTNNNVLFANGTGGNTGRFNAVDRLTLANWQSATGQDANSFSSDPHFIDAANISPNLHISPSSPTVVEAGGADVGVANDFDGQARGSLTPVDIGADAGIFTAFVVDTTPPDTTITAMPADPTNDTTGDFTFSANEPSTFQCSVDGGAFASCASPFATAVLADGPHTFSVAAIDAALNTDPTPATFAWTVDTAAPQTSIDSMPPDPSSDTTGDFIFSASESATFECSVDGGAYSACASPFATAALANGPHTFAVRATDPAGNTDATPASFGWTVSISVSFSGTVNVGAGEAITSLTNPGGLFEQMNAGTISGNVTVNITSDLTAETGAVSLNQQAETGAGGYTIFVQASGTPRLIEGNNAAALINLNGADRVTFSGLAFGPLGLTFRNTGNGATIRLVNDASNNSILSCVVEGQTTGPQGVIHIGSGTTTGNDNNAITGSTVRDRSDAVGVPDHLIKVTRDVGTTLNTNITIANDQLFNFNVAGVETDIGTESYSITGNNIYQTGPTSGFRLGIHGYASGGQNTISQNVVRDMTTDGFLGITIQGSGTFTVSRNRIYNIDTPAGGSSTLFGIIVQDIDSLSTARIFNNMVSLAPTPVASSDIRGITVRSTTAGSLNVSFNSIFIGGTATSGNSWGYLREPSGTPSINASLTSNIFFNNRSGGGDHFAIGDQSSGSGSWSSNYNLFVGTGTTPTNFFDLGTSAGGTPVDFTTWKADGRDASSISAVAGTGPFNVGNLFVSQSDLHLNVSGNNPAVNAGTNTGLAEDFDAQPRPFNGVPDIGADEVQVVPTAADVSLGGRVADANGRGIRNVRIFISGGSMAGPRSAVTNGFGYYRLDGLQAGQTYVVFAAGKRYAILNPSRIITLNEELVDVDFIGQQR